MGWAQPLAPWVPLAAASPSGRPVLAGLWCTPAPASPPHPRAGAGLGVGPSGTGGAGCCGELLPPRATRLDRPKQECWGRGWGGREQGGCSGCPQPPSPALAPRRIALRRMPSIRQTLQEMGVKVSDVFPERRQSRRSGGAGPRNGTAPTLLTNYLDVSLPAWGFHTPTRLCTPQVPPSRSAPLCFWGWQLGSVPAPARAVPPAMHPPRTVRVSSRPSISARSASGPPRRPSRWSLTQARPTCGCRPTSAPPSTAPVVSVGAQPQPQSVPAHSSIPRGAQRGLGGGGLPCTGLSVCCLAGCPLALGQGGFIIPWMLGDQRPSASPASLSLMHHLPLPSFPQPLRLLQVADVHRQQHGLRYPVRERECQRLPQPGHRHGEDMPRICRPGATGSARRCLRAALLPHMSIPSQPGAGGLAGGFSPLQGHLCPSLGVRHPHHPGLR